MTRKAAGPARFPAGLDRLGVSAARPAQSVSRPQRLLREAAKEASRQVSPSGLGLDSAAVRERMVQRLRAQGVRHEGVLAAFGAVPRHAFVDSALVGQAYEDTSLPIGWGQTISKPSVVARMMVLLLEGARARETGSLGRVLEIGTGCGYQVAVLAELARHVVSVERLKPLHDKAREHLAAWRGTKVRLVHGDGRLGHGPNAPYDSIIAAAGGEAIPQAWLDQLAEGGRLVAPMHDPGSGGQVLVVVDKRDGVAVRSQQEPVHFVPLKSGVE